MKQAKKHARGFTLVELMIVVVIISILSVIALPAYTNYMIRGKIPDATSQLATKRVKMEQWYQDNRTYAGATAPGCVNDTTSSKYFTFSCTVQNASAYTIQAQGTGSMAEFTYTIDHNNIKQTTAAPADWAAAAMPASCWITKPGGAC